MPPGSFETLNVLAPKLVRSAEERVDLERRARNRERRERPGQADAIHDRAASSPDFTGVAHCEIVSLLRTLKEIGLRILIGIGAGVVAGVLDLWVYQFSVRGFLAGLAAGVVYYVFVMLLFDPGMRQFPLFLFGFAIVAGSAAAVAWWLVCRGSRLWVAITVGSVLSLAYFASGGLFARRR